MIRILAAIALIALATYASAEETVLLNYVLEERAGPADITTSEFGVLVTTGKAVVVDMGGTAKIEMTAIRTSDSAWLSLVLHDYDSNNQLIEVGTAKAEVPFGHRKTLQWSTAINGVDYSLTVEPSRSGTQHL